CCIAGCVRGGTLYSGEEPRRIGSKMDAVACVHRVLRGRSTLGGRLEPCRPTIRSLVNDLSRHHVCAFCSAVTPAQCGGACGESRLLDFPSARDHICNRSFGVVWNGSQLRVAGKLEEVSCCGQGLDCNGHHLFWHREYPLSPAVARRARHQS